MSTSPFAAFRRLNRNVLLFLAATALVGLTVFGGVFAVLFNLFILRLGFGPEFVGLVNAVGLLAFALPALPAGWLGARWGTRPTLMLGLIVTAIGYGLLALTDLLPVELRAGWLLFTNGLGALGSAVYLVNTSPFLAGVTNARERVHALSAQVAIWPLAGFVGSLVGGALPGLFAPLMAVMPEDPAAYRYPLLLASLTVLPGVLILRQTRPAPPISAAEARAQGKAPLKIIVLVACAMTLQVGGEGVATTFFNVYLDDGLSIPTSQIGLLLALARLASVPAALVTPLIASRWGTRRTFVGASLGIALCMIPIVLIPHWIAAELSFLGIVCTAAIARSTMINFQMDAVGPAWRGIMSAAATTAVGFSWAGMALGGGYAIREFGYPTLFAAGAGLTVAGALVFALFVRAPQTEPAPLSQERGIS